TANFRYWTTAITFSPDGTQLAASSKPVYGSSGGIDIWRLKNGCGCETLHGLTSQVSLVCLSVDGHKLACMSHDWKLAIWDLAKHQLLHVFSPPPGISADNGGI